ncbi:hypothetical protein HG530_009127 [Fusarium avenaceum]|nr:hypothetical protein HG530_009127 [Fusarium avenaceum]
MASEAMEALVEYRFELPAVDNSQQTACEQVKNGNQDKRNIEAHEFQDGLRVGVDSASKSSSAILLAVEELKVLAEHVLETLLAKLVAKVLSNRVGSIAKSKVRDEKTSGEDNKHAGIKVSAVSHSIASQSKDLHDMSKQNSLSRECCDSSQTTGKNEEVLDLDELCISAVCSDQRLMRALFDDGALRHDNNVISLTDGSELVSDDNGGTAFGCLVECFLDDALRVGIKSTRSFIEKKNLGLRYDAAGDSDTKFLDEIVGKGHLGSLLDTFHLLLGGDVFPLGSDQTMLDVVENRPLEENGLLLDKTDISAQPVKVKLINRTAIKLYGTRLGVIPTLDKADNSTLSGSRLTYQSGDLSCWNIQREVLQDGNTRSGGQLGQLNGCNHNRQKDSEDDTRVGNFSSRQHTDTLPESKTETEVNNRVIGREHKTKENRDLFPNCMGLLEVLIELVNESGPHLKRVDCSDAGKDALSNFHCGNHGHDNDSCWCNAQADESEFPLNDEGNNEGSEEGCNTLEEKTQLFGNTSLDQATV